MLTSTTGPSMGGARKMGFSAADEATHLSEIHGQQLVGVHAIEILLAPAPPECQRGPHRNRHERDHDEEQPVEPIGDVAPGSDWLPPWQQSSVWSVVTNPRLLLPIHHRSIRSGGPGRNGDRQIQSRRRDRDRLCPGRSRIPRHGSRTRRLSVLRIDPKCQMDSGVRSYAASFHTYR